MDPVPLLRPTRIIWRKRYSPYRRDEGRRTRPDEAQDLMQTVDYRTQEPAVPALVITLPTIEEVDETIDRLDVAMHPNKEGMLDAGAAPRLVKRPSLKKLVVELALRVTLRRRRARVAKAVARDGHIDSAE